MKATFTTLLYSTKDKQQFAISYRIFCFTDFSSAKQFFATRMRNIAFPFFTEKQFSV